MVVKLAALILLALGLSAPAASASSPSATTRLVECRSSLDPSARTMTVESRMRTIPGARRLQVRFDLQTRLAGRARWTRLPGPGLGVWNTADPAPRRYVFDKRVEGLIAAAGYRMVVRFRWLDGGGRPLAAATRTSPVCDQPDLRPDLEPVRIEIAAGADSSRRRYSIPVRNAGRSPAEPFVVALTVDGVALAPQRVTTGLQVKGRSELVFDGPGCRPGGSIVVRVDADGAVDERDESDNQFVRVCPRD